VSVLNDRHGREREPTTGETRQTERRQRQQATTPSPHHHHLAIVSLLSPVAATCRKRGCEVRDDSQSTTTSLLTLSDIAFFLERVEISEKLFLAPCE
jgi:hypothetical protein